MKKPVCGWGAAHTGWIFTKCEARALGFFEC